MGFKRYLPFFLAFFVIFCAQTANAEVFLDSSNNLFYLKGQTYLRSNDLGLTWASYGSLATSESKPVICENSDKTLYLFWSTEKGLWMKESKNAGISFSREQNIFPDFSADKYNVYVSNGVFHLIFSKNNYIYYCTSMDKGKTFTFPQAINGNMNVKTWESYLRDNAINIAFISDKSIYRISSTSGISGFLNPEEVYRSENSLIGLIPFNKNNAPDNFELAWIEKLSESQYAIKYLSYYSKIPTIAYSSNYPISSVEAFSRQLSTLIKFNILSNPDEEQILIKFKKDGSSINSPVKLADAADKQKAIDGMFVNNGNIYLVLLKGNEVERKALPNNMPSVSIISPSNGFKTNNDLLRISLKASDPDNDALVLGLKLSTDKTFPQEKTLTFSSISAETTINLPYSDGIYYLNAFADDGVTTQYDKAIVAVTLDRKIPTISVSYPKSNFSTSSPSVEIKGTISKEAFLTINGLACLLDKNKAFSKMVPLANGDNIILLIATDEAQNSTSEAIFIKSNQNAPQISILKPQKGSFYKKGSVISIYADVLDKQNNIPEEADTPVFIDNKEVIANISFDPDNNTISGLLEMPKDLIDGEHLLMLEISDSENNIGTSEVSFIMDNSSPIIDKKSLSAKQDAVAFQIVEQGAGIDMSGSIIKVYSGSEETFGKLKIEDKQILFLPDKPLAQGNYRIEYSLRDKIGNSSSQESVSFSLSNGGSFKAEATASDIKILSLQNGPNPFSPKRSETEIIKYELSGPADIDLYVFSLQGTLIYKKSISQSQAQSTISWNGYDSQNNILSSGVYPYSLVVKGSSGRDIKRGRIIVF